MIQKKLKIHIIFLFTQIYFFLSAQISQPDIPYSFQKKLKSHIELPVLTLQELDIAGLILEDSLKGISNRFAIGQLVSIDIKTQGQLLETNDSVRIWQYRVLCPNAFALGIRFTYYEVPPHSKLFVYNKERTKLLGAYTHLNNKPDKAFTIQHIEANDIIIEYEEPTHVKFSSTLVIGGISIAYKSLSDLLIYNDINCPGWESWKTIKRSICRIIFDDVDGSYYCSGSLINNTRWDATPYFLTAYHCINNPLSASSVIVYFNYETNSCNGTILNVNQTVSGADICALGVETDFSLLKLRENPPLSYQPYFAGWDITGNIPTQTAVIHHPKGLYKSIAISNQKASLYPYTIAWDDGSVSPKFSHWQVIFTNGNTNSGSSGSPLLDANMRIIGQLHGGDNVTNYYGALHKSWILKANINNQLKAWLDPDNTQQVILDGTDGNIIPLAKFEIFPKNVCANAPVFLKNFSKGAQNTYNWKFSPSSIEFTVDSNYILTSDTSTNPVIKFLENTTYTITLIVKNNFGTDSFTKQLSVGSIFTNWISPLYNQICGYKVKNLLFETSDSYHFEYKIDTTRFNYKQENNRLFLNLKDTTLNDSTFVTNIQVIARHGSCTTTLSHVLTIEIPKNDFIRNAILLKPGLNGPFNNLCAFVETNEPYPRAGGCLVKDNWCYNSNNSVVNASLWFKVKAPPTGLLNIITQGIDTRIALYEAQTYHDLLNNNFKLIAANDNTLENKAASLKNLNLVPNQLYWLQVDCNSPCEGDYTINIFPNTIEIWPNPAKSHINITYPANKNTQGTLRIQNLAGQVIWQTITSFSPEKNTISYSIEQFTPGIYILTYITDEKSISSKFIILR